MQKKSTAKRSGPVRIVSLAPSVTSILLDLGAGRDLVGVSKWCKHVANIATRPQVGDCWKIDVAEVMRLKPTLLIGSVPFATETVAEILKQPVALLAINPRSLSDVEADIRMLGRLVERTARAESVIARMNREFARVANIAKKRRRDAGQRGPVRVYCEAWPNPRISSPPWVAELVRIAGGQMVVPAGARVSDEEVARAMPDLIVLAWAATGDRAKSRSALRNLKWQELPAIKAGRVTVIRDEWLNTPGPILTRGARELLRAIWGREK
ncbi:MAG: ABC transporter substrate-binding protein [Candidatus Acidiferrales bacterium]